MPSAIHLYELIVTNKHQRENLAHKTTTNNRDPNDKWNVTTGNW